jgi:hypothetical protein
MASGPKIVAIVVIGLLAGGVVYELTREKPQAAPRASVSGPPADAEFTDDSPLGIIASVGGAKTPGRASAAADTFIGKWVPASGWEGPIDDITPASHGVALRLLIQEPRIVGGSYWIVAVVGDDHGCKKGDTVRVQGRIADITSKAGPALTILNRIVLEEAHVVR